MTGTRAASLAAVLAAALSAHAQTLAPEVIAPRVFRTARFTLRAVGASAGEAALLARTVEEDRDRVIVDLGRDWPGTTEIRIAPPDDPAFDRLLPPGAAAPKWAAAVAFPAENLVVMRLPGRRDARATLRHELSHVAVGRLAAGRVPRWFLEGLATIEAGDLWSRKGPSLVRAALGEGVYSFESLRDSFPEYTSEAELAYAQSADFVQFLVDRSGDAKLHLVLRRLVEGVAFDSAFAEAFGGRPRALENEWRRSLARWELLVRYLTSGELWWSSLALLALVAWWRLRVRRRQRLRIMELQEQAEAEAAPDATPPTEAFEAWLEEGEGQAKPAARPSKPTLH